MNPKPVNLTAPLASFDEVYRPLTTGDRHAGEIPDHVDSTTGHDLAP
jgi:hypothetical protein